MKIVIAGGTGFIGRSLTESLIDDGIDVTVLTRRSPDPSADNTDPDTARFERWSGAPGDASALASVLAGADAIVNLAGTPIGPWPWTGGRRRRIVDSRIEPTVALVDAIARLDPADRPNTLINISGTDAYTGLDRTPATETTEPTGGFLADLCRAWEGTALTAETLGVRVVIVRTGFVLGRGSTMTRLLALPFRLGLGGPLGSGRQWMSWVHVDDVVGIIGAAISDPRYRGVVNAVSPTPIREADLARTIGGVLHRPSRMPTPAWLIRMSMGESSVLALGSRRVLPARALAAGYRFHYGDVRAAVADAMGPKSGRPAKDRGC